MSSLTAKEKAKFERLLDMGSGYVSNFSDARFGSFVAEAVEVDIHDSRYTSTGTSKAKKLREFWRIEPDDLVADLLDALIEHQEEWTDDTKLLDECRGIASRLRSGGAQLKPLKQLAEVFDAPHLAKAIHRMEKHIDSDPALAIGSAKELIETCCKTILSERGEPVPERDDLPKLTKATLEVLHLTPDGVPDEKRGSDAIKQVLRSFGSVSQGLAELRNLYGTGHGKHGKIDTLRPRHAKLAVGAAATLATFLFETHQETNP